MIRPAAPGEWPAVLALVGASGLPTADLRPEHVGAFWVARGASGEVAGCVAIETHGDHGLLRSLAVSPEARGQGLGGALVDAALGRAAERGIRRLVLLTTTAEDFFQRRGWAPIAREALPLAVQQSSEFTGGCCASAVCLGRELPTAKGEPE
ncbi:arsenic resistance N-acetyltransferase ArsN2 [Rubricoccus marinus]|uniref:N-acetyltransferase domain-containing protein n=1 Tax=Rubricoccus marinus TaxID=716817 RepID=A0A259U271_9BACT|nr:arsenic resistance N-acetyltransferase ArsN2 [Rubricoccus marinus]OZC04082.1 hypothetical protein BSZ36_14465 [Rubricoccus marinus]